MRISAIIAAFFIGITAPGSPAEAQQLRNASGPANLPPSSFRGPQFVDNRGCVFIRAGQAGAVTWVPRVSRDRRQICGLQPTFATRTTTARTIKRRAVRKVAAAPVVVTPQAAPQTTAKVQPCRGRGFSARYTNETDVRCGPQGTPTRTVIRRSDRTGTDTSTGAGVLKGPKGANRKIVEARMKVPKGYAPAWEDDRLNPLRGVGTSSGKASMNKIWTNTVPRRLVDPGS